MLGENFEETKMKEIYTCMYILKNIGERKLLTNGKRNKWEVLKVTLKWELAFKGNVLWNKNKVELWVVRESFG